MILLDGKCPIADIASFEYDIRYNTTISGSAIASLYQGETDNPVAYIIAYYNIFRHRSNSRYH